MTVVGIKRSDNAKKEFEYSLLKEIGEWIAHNVELQKPRVDGSAGSCLRRNSESKKENSTA